MSASRHALGQWFTAAPVARLALAALGPLDPAARVLDPTCGDGAFLAAAAAAGLRALTGVEVDPAAAAAAHAQLPGATIVVGDLLAAGLPARLGPFDLVLGNPPWVRAGRIDPARKRARAARLAEDWPALDPDEIARLARLGDVAATCTLRALRLLTPGGRAALVLSTALLDADGAAPLWRAIAAVGHLRALIAAPAERWFADAAVNPMIAVLERRGPTSRPAPLRVLRLRRPTTEVARAVGLDALAAACDERQVAIDAGPAAWSAALRAPEAWFAWRDLAGDALVPLAELAEVRRGLTTGANAVFYLARATATAAGLEPRYLAPVIRSPFNGAPAAIAVDPDATARVALALPPDADLATAPGCAAWLRRHRDAARRASVRRRDPWWALPVEPARLFLAKAYGPRFVQRLAPVPVLADQRVYALTPRRGVELAALAAILNALPTSLALEALGRASMGHGAIEWTVADAQRLPVLDPRRAGRAQARALATALRALAPRPVEHVMLERGRADRAALDDAALALVPGGAALGPAMWDALCAAVALRDRWRLPSVTDDR